MTTDQQVRSTAVRPARCEELLTQLRDEERGAERDRASLLARKEALELGLRRKDAAAAILAAERMDAHAAATEPRGKPGTSNTTFAAFDEESRKALQSQATQVSEGLAAPRTLLLLLGLLAVVLGVVAAAASWLGVSQRLEEYR